MPDSLWRGHVRWTVPLVVAIVGAELILLGYVGLYAALPSPEYVALSYADNSTDARAFPSQVVHFAPTPVLGSRALVVDVPESDCEGAGPTWCATVTIRGCLDASCQQLGSFNTSVTGGSVPTGLWPWAPASVSVPSQYSTFLVGLGPDRLANPPGGNATVLLVMEWVADGGWPIGLMPVGLAFLGLVVAGGVVLPGAWYRARLAAKRTAPTLGEFR